MNWANAATAPGCAAVVIAFVVTSPGLAQTKPSTGSVSSSASSTVSAPPPPSVATIPSTSPRATTLADALVWAHEHQPAIKVARARIAAAKAVAQIPSGQWTPQVGVLAQLLGGTSNNTTSSYITDPVLDIARIGGTSAVTSGTFKPYPSSFVGVGVNQQLFDFGRVQAQTVAAESLIDLERFHADADRLDIDLAIKQSFFLVQASKAVLGAADAAYSRSKGHRDLAKAGVDTGMRAPIELTRAEADLTRFDVGRVRAKGGLLIAQGMLAAAVGVTDASLDTAGEGPNASELPPLAKAVADASTRDPLLKQALAAVSGQAATTKAIEAEMRPTIFLTAGLSGRAGGAPLASGATPTGGGFLPVVPNWDVGLVLSWPISDGVVAARVEASKKKQEVLEAQLDEKKADQVAIIRTAYRTVELAQASLPALERALDAAKTNYAQADARFKSGLASSIELADAETLLTEAEIQLAIGKFELARARAAFGRVIAEGL